MTPEQCQELAEYHSHMAKECFEKAAARDGFSATAFDIAGWGHQESARYWREKAGD